MRASALPQVATIHRPEKKPIFYQMSSKEPYILSNEPYIRLFSGSIGVLPNNQQIPPSSSLTTNHRLPLLPLSQQITDSPFFLPHKRFTFALI